MTPTPNIPLLRKAVEWVKAEHEREPYVSRRLSQAVQAQDPTALVWRQLFWSTKLRTGDDTACGTACCVAGYVAHLSPEVKKVETAWVTLHTGQTLLIEEFATTELGLTEDQAERLFRATNSAATVTKIASEIAGEPL